MALKPHEPGQGSLQTSLIQARFAGHSELMLHSGLQLGARPTKFGKQEHAGVSPTNLHRELGPQGDGMQGLDGKSSFFLLSTLRQLIKGSPV